MVDFQSILSSFDLTSSSFIIKLIAAILILIIGLIIGRLASKLIKKVLHELETNRILKEQAGIKIPFEEFISTIAKYLIYFIAIIWVLNQLGLTTTVLHIILIIALIIIVVFIILAFKDFIPNVTAGFFIHQKERLKEGDIIRVKDIEGKIIQMSLVETKVKTEKGDTVFIPNSLLAKSEIIKKK